MRTSKPRKSKLGIILCTALLAAACGSGGGESGDSAQVGGLPATIKVGVPLDLSGAAGIAGVGTSERDGVRLAAKEINDTAFLGGSKIELVEIDTKADKQEAVQAVLRLAADQVDAVVGFTLTPSFLAAGPQLQQNGIPTMAVGLSAAGVTEVGDYMFRLYPDMANVMPPADKEFAETFTGLKTAAYLYQSDSEAAKIVIGKRKEVLEGMGISTVGEETFVGTDTDVRAQLTKLKQANPDVLVTMPLPGMMSTIYLQLDEIGYDGPVFMAPDVSDATMEQAGKAMQCFVYVTAWNGQSTEGNNPHFLDYWQQHGEKRSATVFEAAGYASLWSMAHAFKAAGSTDKKAVRDALAGLRDIDSPFGKIGFTENRAASIKGTKLQIVDSKIQLFDPQTAASCK
ncbi:ABC transporter substrate-binding protein [Nonomuraea sp. MCN248]|uniref:ABC transporter substrate-binding protein n=1 Tax=Nonomuraea corallina TaxID=2989783 RepID=A0ABT4SKL9_9ACTN|nr:ABC transporter substrate-binding protein [Nonomuraea corallina]MDA0637732.1 ABC transporter substrate-binding protein [Nonomuraea corallina]